MVIVVWFLVSFLVLSVVGGHTNEQEVVSGDFIKRPWYAGLGSYARQYAFLRACRVGDLNTYRISVKTFGIDPSIKENQCLMSASKNGHTDIVRDLLLDMRVDIYDHDNLALINAAGRCHLDVVKLLVGNYRFKNELGCDKAMKAAAKTGCTSVILFLLSDSRTSAKLSDKQTTEALAKYRQSESLLKIAEARDGFYDNALKYSLSDKGPLVAFEEGDSYGWKVWVFDLLRKQDTFDYNKVCGDVVRQKYGYVTPQVYFRKCLRDTRSWALIKQYGVKQYFFYDCSLEQSIKKKLYAVVVESSVYGFVGRHNIHDPRLVKDLMQMTEDGELRSLIWMHKWKKAEDRVEVLGFRKLRALRDKFPQVILPTESIGKQI
ncbi:hypothetical protein MP228_003961 [Amoeboaphelidium protococcarum]|nr:hypothetical protein MP228_003961 [Amoeboaphelidium protococcarum]